MGIGFVGNGVGGFGISGGGRKVCSRRVDGVVRSLSEGNNVSAPTAGLEEKQKDQVDKYVTVRASHILLETEEMADACMEQLNSKPETFEDVAKSLSQCPSNTNGGDIGWFSRKMMVPEFEDACFDNEIGSLSKVKSGFGWHVIRVDGKGTVPADISAAEFDRRYNDPTERSKLQLVDVREKELVEKFELDGFISLPALEQTDLGKALKEGTLGLDPTAETVVVCQAGYRSSHFAKYLAQQGFDKVRSLAGGLDNYQQKFLKPNGNGEG
ncbi:hypothetical protein NDN08_003218 [Rhodosorus marinus]|uniref:Peptidyl-prolyl cis-trans isomerase n=1 Tax=Rhodosorus marinus TaxID=101924 RepID=A0AAV8UXF5_9RHOD|nr:hypothetical protein NDN08_003218 [Rhodosorus marinus]